MRKLSRKQKNFIRKYVKKYYADSMQPTGLSPDKPTFFSCDSDLRNHAYDALDEMNCFENMNSHIDRFVDEIRHINDCTVI